jgi:hypothetical protein
MRVEPGQVLIARLHHVGERHPLGEPPETGGAVGDQARPHVRAEGHQPPARLPANQSVERGGQGFEQQTQRPEVQSRTRGQRVAVRESSEVFRA